MEKTKVIAFSIKDEKELLPPLKMYFCPRCGSVNADKMYKFCPNCGVRLDWSI